jgi:hypothetical protein
MLMAEQKTQRDSTIICMPSHSVLLLPGFIYAIGVVAVYSIATSPYKRPGDLLAEVVTGSLCLLLGIFIHVLIASYAKADAPGITWRVWGRTHRTRWHEVQGYYLLPTTANRIEQGSVETNTGQFQITQVWKNASSFKSYVQTHATNAPMKQWLLRGTDPNDPRPITFNYSMRMQWIMLWLMVCCILCILGIGEYPAITHFSVTVKSLGARWAWGSIAMGLVMPATLIGFVYAIWPQLRDVRNHSQESVTTSVDGITLTTPETTIHLEWQRISGLFIGDDAKGEFLYTVESGGDTISFSQLIGNFALLKRIVEHWTGLTWDERGENSDVFRVKQSNWVVQGSNINSKLYHYQNRPNRAFLWIAWAIPILPVISTYLTHWIDPLAKTHLATGFICAFGLIALWLTWRYKAAAIVTDDRGITEFSAFGRRFIAWEDVASYRNMEYFAMVKGKKTTLWFWQTISSTGALKEDIQKRAINSSNKEWKVAQR